MRRQDEQHAQNPVDTTKITDPELGLKHIPDAERAFGVQIWQLVVLNTGDVIALRPSKAEDSTRCANLFQPFCKIRHVSLDE